MLVFSPKPHLPNFLTHQNTVHYNKLIKVLPEGLKSMTEYFDSITDYLVITLFEEVPFLIQLSILLD